MIWLADIRKIYNDIDIGKINKKEVGYGFQNRIRCHGA